MPNRYSEEEAVQRPASELLHTLGWEVVYCFDDEVLGVDGTLGRESYRDVLLKRELEHALIELNGHLEIEECRQAIVTLEATLATDSLLQTNEKKYQMLRDGIPVERARPDGTAYTDHAMVFDFEHPENNSFVVCEELRIENTMYHRRPDMVGFVNGVPLLLIEFKRHDKEVLRAYEDNYTDYQDTISEIFYYNAFSILSNGFEAKVGTLGSAFEFFHDWKRLREEDEGTVELAVMLRGVCDPANFLDIFENFILFDHGPTPTAKILARNHQYLGVNEAVQAYRERKIRDGKLGVFWHTQGSGKSYSMVFLARKILQRCGGSPTFLIVTDRDELDTQISGTFGSCGCLGNEPSERFIATSGADLVNKLRGNPRFIFSLIQKFNDPVAEPITPEHDIIIFSDEAHRTNNGVFADNMCRMLPTASRIGFTGTPLLAYDNITKRTFGGYISVYDFRRAVEDGATVPLYYENRSDILGIDNPEINERLADAIEDADLDPDQIEKLERDLNRDIHIIMATPRLQKIALDFVHHYSGIWESGKAMFVCVNKVTTVLMYNLVQKYWQEALAQEKLELKGLTQQEAIERQRKIDWMSETEMAVVVSQEQNEVATFRKWDLDIQPHRLKMNERNLEKDFKDESHPFRIVFVCAMWLTGFDVRPLSTIYFDKPLKAHTLMQAIARANRVNAGKSNGLIVDYIGVVKALRKALADYTVNPDGAGVDPAIDKSAFYARIEELITAISGYLGEQGFSLSTLLVADGFDKMAALKDGANAVSATDEVKKRFAIMARELLMLFKFVQRKELSREVNNRYDAIRAIYNEITRRREVADTGDIMVQLQRIVDEYVTIGGGDGAGGGSADGGGSAGGGSAGKAGTRFDISKIDFDRLRQEFVKTRQKNLLVDDLRSVIESRLEVALRENPRRIDYFKRYENIISEYNSEQNKARIEKTFIDLMRLSSDLDDAQKSYIADGFNNPQQQAVFEMLCKETLTPAEIKKVKAVSVELVNTIETRLQEMVHWTDKSQTQDEVKVIIRDTLWENLSEESYPNDSLQSCVTNIYEYFYTRDRVA